VSHLLFVDANVLLDFYSIGGKDQLGMLKQLVEKRGSVITNSLLRGEFERNRNNILGRAYNEFDPTKKMSTAFPTFLVNSDDVGTVKRSKEELKRVTNTVREGLLNAARTPNEDPVLGLVDDLCGPSGDTHVEDGDEFELILKRAKDRFVLGHPPRKGSDTKVGDSFHWEWVLECASRQGASVAVVSRDGDYGTRISDKLVLNTFLSREFARKVGTDKSVEMFSMLSDCLDRIGITATVEAKEAEQKLVIRRADFPSHYSYDQGSFSAGFSNAFQVNPGATNTEFGAGSGITLVGKDFPKR